MSFINAPLDYARPPEYTHSRKNADKLLGERAADIIQLDIDEDPDDTPTTAYTIDAFQCGKTAQQRLHSSQLNAFR
jgi:hypothetical protein